jgi:hypothetical protein
MKTVLAIIEVIGSLVLAWLQQRPREDPKQKAQNDALQQHYDEIDARRPDFDGAIGRLRDRANRDASAGRKDG